MVLVVLDGAIANVALPTIASTLKVSPADSVWIVTAYQIALVVAILPTAALGESLGYRRVFLLGVSIFTAASAGCALSPSLGWLLTARFVQGLGGAAMMALAVALLRFVYPPQRLGAVIGWNSLTIACSAALGPSIGAAIISFASWPWLFVVNLPVGAVVLLAGRALPAPQGTARKLDLVSVALNAATFGGFFMGVNYLAIEPVYGGGLLALAVVCLVALIRREMPVHAPIIPLDLLRDHSFRISVIASVCCFSGQMSSYIALPFYLQHGLHQDALRTGIYMTPWPLAVAFAGPLSGRLTDRFSTAWLCATGCFCLATGLALISLWPFNGNLYPLIFFSILCGLGFGFFQVPNNRNMLLSAPRQRSGAAGGMQGMARLTGQTVGALVMTLLFSFDSVEAVPRLGLGFAAVLALAGGLVSVLRVRDAGKAS